MRHLVASVLLAMGPGCGCNLLTNPDSSAVSAPGEADVALGASHDVLVVACQQKLTLGDILLGVGATAVFVGVGRLDAAFYLPGALANPKCKDTQYSVSGAVLEGDAFEMETTQNEAAFKLHTKREGESVFSAQVAVGGKTHEVSSTFRAHKPDRIVFAPVCQKAPDGVGVLEGWVPAGKSANFTHRLFKGMTPLTGYGYVGVSHPRMTVNDTASSATFTAERGPFTVTSEVDRSFMLQLNAYDPTDYDRVVLERADNEVAFVGSIVPARIVATIQGKLPCAGGFATKIEWETPSVCRQKMFEGFLEQSGYPVQIEALATGTCRVSLTMPGSNLSASVVQFQVYRAFEPGADLPGAAKENVIKLTDMFMTGPDDMTVVGWKDQISGFLESVKLRRTNGAWGAVEVKNPPRTLQAVHGNPASGELFAVGSRGSGAHWSGTAWDVFDAGVGDVQLHAVAVNSPSDVWAAGEDGVVTHFDGTQWSPVDAGQTGRFRDFRSAWSPGDGGVWLAGYTGAKRWDGSQFVELIPGFGGDAGFSAGSIRGTGGDDVWMSTSRGLLHWNGAAWSTHTLGANRSSGELWPLAGGFVYALVTIGPGSSRPMTAVVRYDGTKAVTIPVPSGLAIGGWGNDVIVLGKDKLYRYRHDPADVFP